MSAGQKLLADLLGITNSAAESLSIQQVKDLEPITRETRGNDSKEQAEAPKMEGDDFDGLVGTTKKMGERMMQEDDLQSSKSLLSGSLEDEFDESRCIKVKVPANLLKEKLSASDTSVNSMLNSAESSVERQPIPEPSDFVRPGVFVSSAQKDVRQSTTNHSIGTKQRSKEHENKKHLQLVKRMREHPQIQNSVGLIQGKENSMEQTCDAQPHKENEVVVLQFEQGTKKSDVQEKFKSRMSSAPIKKRVIPNIVAPSRETHPSQSAKLDAGQSSIADTKSVGQPQNTADQAVQYAALATSAAIAPFLQIQNALENQIASLVSTMSLAHSAEGNMKMTTQEDRLRELEDKIIDVLDKRMARIENVKDHATQRKMNATNGKEIPVSDGNEEFHLKQKLGNSGITGELDHLRFKSAEPKSGHSVAVMLHDGPDNGYPDVKRYGATRNPSGLTSFDNDLQLIPTRDDQLVRRDTSGRTLHRQQNPILDPDIRHPLLKSCHSQPNMIPRSYPTLSHASDKALSPFSRRTKMQTNAVSPFLRNAKTQTSSSESSLVSEKSLLETPLPRSKIPVPFSRYTPKSEKGSRHDKRKVITSLRNENQLLKGILKQSEEPRILDKENISPKTSSPKRIQGVPRL